jgi:hypothetical protein
MKCKYFLIIGMLLFQTLTHAQVPTVTNSLNAGKLLVELINNIKPASMISSFAGKKKDLISSATKATSGPAIAKTISSLAGYIKPGMFKSAFNLKNLQQLASTAKTMADAKGLMKNLEGGIKPEGMAEGWDTKRTNWLSSLDLLK